jgi:hypothetical protein
MISYFWFFSRPHYEHSRFAKPNDLENNCTALTMKRLDPTRDLVAFFASRCSRTKFLIFLWVVYITLVALGIHGSSTGVTAEWWAPERQYTGYLFGASTHDQEKLLQSDSNGAPHKSNIRFSGDRSILMNNARTIRWDELAIFTPSALSQLAQRPRFPVINTSIGNGQNMLVVPHTPVLHISTLARPATWGYFILGGQRGLAWFWWFQIFACFTVLYLLFEIILRGNAGLAAFGAFWFCASAYVVCWSQWPAHVIFFAVLGCLAAYHLFKSNSRSVQLVSAILLGLSLPGFVMIMYPPWQVPAGYFVVLIFIALFVRDGLHITFRTDMARRSLFLSFALLFAAALTLSWLKTCLPDLKVMANTVYPGTRVSLGGDYSLAMLFKGLYNCLTIYHSPAVLRNQSEAASFYYLFPAVFFALPLHKKLRRNFGIIGWSLAAYIIGMFLFLFVGLSETFARLTLLSYVPTYRADLTIGLASILLCVYVLSLLKAEEPGKARWDWLVPGIVSGSIVSLFILHGISLVKLTGGFPATRVILVISLIMGLATFVLLRGKIGPFCALIGVLVTATTVSFNPLATSLDHIYESELAKAILQINGQSKDRPFWLCYGGVHTGQLVTILGCRSISGVHWPPQLSLWRALDPYRVYEKVYNQYGEVALSYLPDDDLVTFSSGQEGQLAVEVSPTNHILRDLGARYVLIMANTQPKVNTSTLRLLYKSTFDTFSVFEIP